MHVHATYQFIHLSIYLKELYWLLFVRALAKVSLVLSSEVVIEQQLKLVIVILYVWPQGKQSGCIYGNCIGFCYLFLCF